MANPKLIPVPFANGGAKTTIPIARASNDPAEMPDYNEGFPPITSTPLAAGGKAPRRPDFNGILNDITANIRHVNSGGFFTFDAAFAAKVGGYPKGAILLSNDGSKKYVSLIDGNTSDFNVSVDVTKWAKAAMTERETQDIAWGTGKTSAPWVSQSDLQNQNFISATTAGTAPAYTASITPAPTLSAGLRIRSKFHAATSAASTLNLNALGAKSVKQMDSTGALVDAVLFTNQLADLEFDGTNWILLDPAPINYTTTTAGTAPTYTANVVPAPASLAVGLSVVVNFHAGTTAAATLNLNALGAKSLRQYDGNGSKIPAVISPNTRSEVLYDGTDWVLLDALPVLSTVFFQSTAVAQSGYTANTLYPSGLTITAPRTGRMLVLAKNTFQPRGMGDMCAYVLLNGNTVGSDIRGGANINVGWETPQSVAIVSVVAGDVISSAVQSNGGGTVVGREVTATYI